MNACTEDKLHRFLLLFIAIHIVDCGDKFHTVSNICQIIMVRANHSLQQNHAFAMRIAVKSNEIHATDLLGNHHRGDIPVRTLWMTLLNM